MCLHLIGEEEMWDRVASVITRVLEGSVGGAISIDVERRASAGIVTIVRHGHPVAMWGVIP